jgi:hypothetical protein
LRLVVQHAALYLPGRAGLHLCMKYRALRAINQSALLLVLKDLVFALQESPFNP